MTARRERAARLGATAVGSVEELLDLLAAVDPRRPVVVHDPGRATPRPDAVLAAGVPAVGVVAVTDTLKACAGEEVVATVAREDLLDVVGPVVLDAAAARRHAALLPDLAALVQALRAEGAVGVVDLTG